MPMGKDTKQYIQINIEMNPNLILINEKFIRGMSTIAYFL